MKKGIILFIIALAALLTFQYKVVVPIIYDIAASDFFLEESGNEINRTSSESLLTSTAFQQCNSHIANELLSDISISFSDKPINAFGLGNYRYILNSDLEITPEDAPTFTRRYACRIKYTNGDDTTDLSNLDNWSIEGVSGLDNI